MKLRVGRSVFLCEGWRWDKGWQASSGHEKLFQARGGSPQLRSQLFLAYNFGGVRSDHEAGELASVSPRDLVLR